MSHTPAPWVVTVCDQNVYVLGGPDNDDIAEFSFKGDYAVSISGDEAIANATLCAAAPDLLAALKALLPDGWGDDDTMDHMLGVKQARVAIAKATTVKS